MQMDVSEIEGGIRLIRLTGRLDVEGTQAIDLKFTALTATQRAAGALATAGIDTLIPVHHDLESACRALEGVAA